MSCDCCLCLCKYECCVNVNTVYDPQSLAALPPELTVSKRCHGDSMNAWNYFLFLFSCFFSLTNFASKTQNIEMHLVVAFIYLFCLIKSI